MAKKFQYFDRKRFTRDERTGYYLCSTQSPDGTRKRMHVYVWEYYNGPVQDNYHVHHIDGDKSNNNIAQKSPQKKNSNHFKWIDGKTDKLEVDEVNDIEELLEDDDLFDN